MKIHLNRISIFIAIIFFISGLGLLSTSVLAGLLVILFSVLIFPPFLSYLNKIGKKPKLSYRIIIGVLLIFFSIVLTPSVPDSDVDSSISTATNNQTTVAPTDTVTQTDTEDTSVNTPESPDENATISPAVITQETPIVTVTPNQASNDLSELKVHFIDVGQGESILIESEDQFMLIDAGENNQGELVANYLKQQNVDELTYVIGTHPHSDHIGGLDTVINTLDVVNVMMPNVVHDTQTFEDVLDAVSNKGLKLTKPVVGATYNLGESKFTILAPNKWEYSNLNNYSIVIKLTHGDNSFLFTGDAEELSESEILANGLNLSADVLSAGHHGSDTSNSLAFLKKVNPESAIISVGENNKYNHPSIDTLNNFTNQDIDIYRTDELGTIIVSSDGEDILYNRKPNNNITSTPAPTATIVQKPTQSPTQKPIQSPTPSQKPTANTKEDNKGATVYITDTGSKYHVDGCRFLKKSKIPIKLSEAKQNYDPCGICNPPR